MIPNELTVLSQWIVRRDDKIPLNPRTGQRAASDDPTTWSDYGTAVAACNANPGVGLGFMLTANDPYCVVDLDDPNKEPGKFTAEQIANIIRNQTEIFTNFDSYSEVSPNNGLHIWVRGNLESGAKLTKQCVEIYSSGRYMTVTGNVYKNGGIQNRQMLVDELYTAIRAAQGQHGGAVTAIESQPQTREDKAVYAAAASAVNGQKFTTLYDGEWRGHYASQSEADFALIDIIAFYSDNTEQVTRLFMASALAQRLRDGSKKKYDKYVPNMVKRSFDRKLPTVTIESIPVDEKPRVTLAKTKLDVPKLDFDWTVPPGVVGEIAKYFYQSSIRPVKEISLAGALAFYAGIVGRAYNVSGTGLNQYIVLLAQTGVGKEGATRGISKLVTALELQIPAVTLCVGPSSIASPQGLVKHLSDKSQCFVSLMGEFGLWLQKVVDKNAKANEVGIRRALLDLYNKSGAGDTLHGSVYSDTSKNVSAIHHPAFSLLGESTPVEFYRALDESSVGDGFLPRFTLIEYKGQRPPMNDWHESAKPDPDMISRLAGQIRRAKELEGMNQFVRVDFDKDAALFSKQFNKQCDDHINASEEELLRQLWNRAHLRVLRLAALLAVGVNADTPVITMVEMQWAHQMVIRGINTMLDRFRAGDVGKNAGLDDQNAVLLRSLRKYLNTVWVPAFGKAHRVTQEMHSKRITTYAYLQHTCAGMTCFRTANYPSQALKQTIEDAIRSGVLSRVSGSKMGGELYFIQDID